MIANRSIVGTITMTQGISNDESLFWFEKWLYTHIKELNAVTIVEVILFDEDHVKDTFKYLTDNGWVQTGWNELLSQTGQYIHILYDAESGQELNKIKHVD